MIGHQNESVCTQNEYFYVDKRNQIEYLIIMTRRTNRRLLDEWLHRNGPDGVTKLAFNSGISASTITKARFGISVPKKESTRRKICSVLEVSEDDLFPLIRGKRSA